MNNVLENNDASWIRDLWIGSFTGICGSALLWDNMHRRELWPHFGRLRAFVAGYDFDESNDDQKGWVPYHDFDEMHYENWQRKPGIVDLFYLRSPDKLNAVGVLANRTFNFYTQWTDPLIYPNPGNGCFSLGFDPQKVALKLIDENGRDIAFDIQGQTLCCNASDGKYYLRFLMDGQLQIIPLIIKK
ncbi:MAG: hypothetical protein AB7V36_14085 [Bacteroidales bacterium]